MVIMKNKLTNADHYCNVAVSCAPLAVAYIVIFTIQYSVPLFSLCTKSLIAVFKDENEGSPFC